MTLSRSTPPLTWKWFMSFDITQLNDERLNAVTLALCVQLCHHQSMVGGFSNYEEKTLKSTIKLSQRHHSTDPRLSRPQFSYSSSSSSDDCDHCHHCHH